MKNKRKSILLSVLLVLILAVPVFAENTASEEKICIPGACEAPAGEAAGAPDSVITESEAAGPADKQNEKTQGESGNASEEMPCSEGDMTAADDEKEPEGAAEPDKEADGSDADTVTEAEKVTAGDDGETVNLVVIGKGSLSSEDDGTIVCEPARGYEVVSITADRDAEGIKAGRQIPEDEISEMQFEDDTTVTAVFDRPYEDSPSDRPASAAAVFAQEDQK